MKYKNLLIEKKEHKKLLNLLDSAHYDNAPIFKRAIGTLKNELKTVKICNENDMPEDVVRFNSQVTIETPFEVTKTYQIVRPDERDLKRDKISILSPMALALFGYSTGDEIEWQFPSGLSKFKIKQVQKLKHTTSIHKQIVS
ncbi:GreA/GreB family elongation factor [uncultured Planktosalinus sp.]|uniref:GreA/GreB family elongation factor n=1 Tax=uncultured Planktosalinus sp. TaxID=1810935 RepID=UPI0030DCD41F